jgi:hypothetical protein
MTPIMRSFAPKPWKYRLEYVEGIGPEKNMSTQLIKRIRKLPRMNA